MGEMKRAIAREEQDRKTRVHPSNGVASPSLTCRVDRRRVEDVRAFSNGVPCFDDSRCVGPSAAAAKRISTEISPGASYLNCCGGGFGLRPDDPDGEAGHELVPRSHHDRIF